MGGECSVLAKKIETPLKNPAVIYPYSLNRFLLSARFRDSATGWGRPSSRDYPAMNFMTEQGNNALIAAT